MTKTFENGRITLATAWAQVFSRAKNLPRWEISPQLLPQRGRNADRCSAPCGGVALKKSDEIFSSARKDFAEKNNHLRFRKPRFAEQAPNLRESASGGKGECAAFYNKRAPKQTGHPEKDLQSKDFLGRGATSVYKQAANSRARKLPCCDERRREKTGGQRQSRAPAGFL